MPLVKNRVFAAVGARATDVGRRRDTTHVPAANVFGVVPVEPRVGHDVIFSSPVESTVSVKFAADGDWSPPKSKNPIRGEVVVTPVSL